MPIYSGFSALLVVALFPVVVFRWCVFPLLCCPAIIRAYTRTRTGIFRP